MNESPDNPPDGNPIAGSKRCGLVALVGRPNVGKSTLLNHLLGQKLSITSRKPQTTRHNLLGIDTRGDFQAIYVDTPGIHAHEGRGINRHMVKSATSALQDVDIVVMLLEQDKFTEEDEFVLRQVANCSAHKVVALNKIDRLEDKQALLPALAKLQAREVFSEYFPISALHGSGLDVLREAVFERLPAAPHMFDADQITDQSERFLVSEIVREKLMRQLGDELPHRATVVIEMYREQPHIVDIAANIFVERQGQKRIVIGKQGERLKQIGQAAREDIETLLQRKVMLRLWVKIKPNWTNDTRALLQFGYDKGH